MNVWLHPAITVLWLVALIVEIALLSILCVHERIPRFLFAFICLSTLKTAAMILASALGWATSYKVVHWGGSYLLHLFAAGIAVSACAWKLGITPRSKRENVGILYATLLAGLVIGLMCNRFGSSMAWASLDQSMQMWVCGIFVAVSMFTKPYPDTNPLLPTSVDTRIHEYVEHVRTWRTHRKVLWAFLFLYGSGFALATIWMWLPATIHWTIELAWVTGLLTQCAVFGYLAVYFRKVLTR